MSFLTSCFFCYQYFYCIDGEITIDRIAIGRASWYYRARNGIGIWNRWCTFDYRITLIFASWVRWWHSVSCRVILKLVSATSIGIRHGRWYGVECRVNCTSVVSYRIGGGIWHGVGYRITWNHAITDVIDIRSRGFHVIRSGWQNNSLMILNAIFRIISLCTIGYSLGSCNSMLWFRRV